MRKDTSKKLHFKGIIGRCVTLMLLLAMLVETMAFGVAAAANDHSSGFGGEDGNTNKTTNPDSATVGSPGSYSASFTVASVSGKKENYMFANGKDVVFFTQSYSTSAEEYDFFEMMGIKAGEKKVYEYVTVPGLGLAINYAGIDVRGKIALVSRGDITFEEKVQFAQEAGAIAVIIYNVYGDITMTIGNHAKIPAVSIGRDEGEMLAANETGTFEFNLENVAGPFMSDFSSWGLTPDLKLKPEITAHGGNIYSAVVGGEYDEQSGTSMAAPNMCGTAVLIRQYVNEKFPNLSNVEALYGCSSLESFTINGQLEEIGYRALSGCSKITEITLPDGAVSIDNEAFYNTGISKIIFRANTAIEHLGNNVFPAGQFTIDLAIPYNYKVESGAIYNKTGDTLVVVVPSDAIEFTVPKSVKYIVYGAFTRLKNLQSVSFESGSALVEICDYAFAGCQRLTTVNLPVGNDIVVGSHAFYEAFALANIDFSTITELGEYAFYRTPVTNVNLTKQNVKIGKDSFMHVLSLNSLTLGNGADIASGAFQNCGVVTVTLDGNAIIGDRAFFGCKKLMSVEAPKITAIGEASFANCQALASFDADNLVTIGDGAFFDINTDTTTLTTAVTSLAVLDLPKVETVGKYAFAYSAGIRTANLPALKSFGERSFAFCERLETITMSEAVKENPEAKEKLK